MRTSPQGASTHISVDKQQALAVLSMHDEYETVRSGHDVRGMRRGLSTLWTASERLAPVPLPELQEDLYGSAYAGVGFDVYLRREGRPGPAALA